jgi:N-terminal acetyltransferase B complex catalytic subunit
MAAAHTIDLVLGKAEGKGEKWHGHVTAITIAAEYRRLGLARRLMAILEDVSDRMYASH